MDYNKFQKSLKHLELQFENFQGAGKRDYLTELDKEALAESVIQRFETCYDSLWKTLRRHMSEIMGLPELPNSPKPVFRIAHENNLLPIPIEDWLRYSDARVDTSHDYSGEKAQQCIALMPDFIANSTRLYQALTGKNWE